MSKSNIKPTDSELEILQILWQNGAASVREVNEILNEQRSVGYTTTLKIMQIMTDKNLVERDTSKRTHIYNAVAAEKATKNNLLKEFINVAFSGSSAKMVMQALGSQKPSQADLDEIKSLIDQLEKDK
jgi:predicted transcriptional regulator